MVKLGLLAYIYWRRLTWFGVLVYFTDRWVMVILANFLILFNISHQSEKSKVSWTASLLDFVLHQFRISRGSIIGIMFFPIFINNLSNVTNSRIDTYTEGIIIYNCINGKTDMFDKIKLVADKKKWSTIWCGARNGLLIWTSPKRIFFSFIVYEK